MTRSPSSPPALAALPAAPTKAEAMEALDFIKTAHAKDESYRQDNGDPPELGKWRAADMMLDRLRAFISSASSAPAAETDEYDELRDENELRLFEESARLMGWPVDCVPEVSGSAPQFSDPATFAAWWGWRSSARRFRRGAAQPAPEPWLSRAVELITAYRAGAVAPGNPPPHVEQDALREIITHLKGHP